ncbi:MAG: GlsB/YeaQ/YmgE family stress response membrane protein [Micromonosporaceae bacterium]
MNFLYAVVVGAVIGGVGGYVLRGKLANAIWLAPALAVAGAVIASVLALFFGQDPSYGWKEATVQVVLALAGVGVVAYLASRGGSDASSGASNDAADSAA